MKYEADAPKIPTAALSAEDAMWVARLAAQGQVSMHLVLTPQTLPDADSHNVLADLPGREKPDEVVLVSGHLDSWDLAQGAIDDGGGVAAAMGALHVLKSLGLQPRRTVRVVAWMNEENGSGGSKAYFAANQAHIERQCAAIESDSGSGLPLGVEASVTPESLDLLKPVIEALRPIGATVLDRRDGEVGADISPLQDAGVPGFAPLVDTREYFWYHHTAADTLDKVKPDNLRRQVAVMAVLAYYLAEMPDPLPRVPVRAAE
jgi:Zn-dependent M28 family amino/carboxypeptidase